MKWRVKWKWVVLWSLWAARLAREALPPRRVSGGALRGERSRDGSIASYRAVPYATINHHNRFKDAQPNPKWEGVYEAFDENVRCYQRFWGNMVSGQEDCLTLNVYTPLSPAHNTRPVMVFIHGGGFRDGSNSPFLYGPEYLVKHDIILVTINYRLEVLGFLCLGIKEAPGNAGLKDQVEALKWVQRNIRAFGGNPDNVTIFGESAGAASVMYHLVSPMSKGLFHKAIIQSGSAVSPWSIQYDPLKTAIQLAQQMGYNTNNPYEIYNFFMNISPEELLRARVPRANGDIVLSENIFVPCIEKKFPGVERFLPDNPMNLISKGQYNKVPIIIGYNSAEGYMFAGKENDTTIARMDFIKALPRDLSFPSDEEKNETAKKLKELYMGNSEIGKESLVKVAKFQGDSGITFPVTATIDLLLKSGHDRHIYAYKLQYDGWLNIAKMFFGFRKAPGATHADDLFYMFKLKVTTILSLLETEMIDTLTRLWTNFAKFGNPTPEDEIAVSIKWQPLRKEDPKVLVIDKQISTVPLWDDEDIRFWNATYSKFRRKV